MHTPVPPLKDFLFLLAGFGCEYVLTPLAHFLRAQGLDHIACDFQQGPLPPLPERPLIIVSSQHPGTSSALFRALWGHDVPYSYFLAPDELFARYPARCKVCIPHDLEAPVRQDELPYMDLFDLYCSPFPVNPALARHCPSIHTGWIKHNALDVIPEAVRTEVAERGVFFVNHIVSVLAAGGADYLMARFPLPFQAGVPVKLPQWPGCEALAEGLRARGVRLIADSTPSTPLIAASRALYVNAPGSVIAEAHYVGTPVVRLDQPDQVMPPVAARRGVPFFDFELLLSTLARLCARIDP